MPLKVSGCWTRSRLDDSRTRSGQLTQTVGPSRETVIRRVGALMPEQTDAWAVSCRYLPVEELAGRRKDTDTATMIAAR